MYVFLGTIPLTPSADGRMHQLEDLHQLEDASADAFFDCLTLEPW